jgi:hypothetical protein
MATFDFSPLLRSTVGFDQLPAIFAQALEREDGGYPPYNVEKIGEDRYRIVLAVAGFSRDDIEIAQEESRLTFIKVWLSGPLRANSNSRTTLRCRCLAGRWPAGHFVEARIARSPETQDDSDRRGQRFKQPAASRASSGLTSRAHISAAGR